MGVPNTNTFNMQNVSSTVDPSKSQLTQLIEVANAQSPSLWDPAYSGSKNSLLNFRNYDGGGTDYYPIILSPATFPVAEDFTVFTTRNPITGLVTNDVLFYWTDDDGYTPYPGAGSTYSYFIFNQGTFFGCTSASCPNISVSSSGVVTTNGCQCP